jgi:hypothetical protein
MGLNKKRLSDGIYWYGLEIKKDDPNIDNYIGFIMDGQDGQPDPFTKWVSESVHNCKNIKEIKEKREKQFNELEVLIKIKAPSNINEISTNETLKNKFLEEAFKLPDEIEEIRQSFESGDINDRYEKMMFERTQEILPLLDYDKSPKKLPININFETQELDLPFANF